VPELEAWMARSADGALADLASALTEGFALPVGQDKRLRAVIRLALDFWTWRRLDAEGLGDDEGAEVMTASLEGALVR
jgi:hypothetical protein